MIDIDPIQIKGKWILGYALDMHTISSELVGYDEYGHEVFDTKRTPLGEALYALKYRFDKNQLGLIAETVANFMISKGISKKITALVPVPPANTSRPFQPVTEIAKLVGEKLNIRVDADYIIKAKDTPELKVIFDPVKRQDILKNAYKARDLSLNGKNVLLFDDLYRSGATLQAIASLLVNEVGVATLYVITLTKTRTLR